jgi:hypothetical protein
MVLRSAATQMAGRAVPCPPSLAQPELCHQTVPLGASLCHGVAFGAVFAVCPFLFKLALMPYLKAFVSFNRGKA